MKQFTFSMLLFFFISLLSLKVFADWGFYHADRSWIGINFNGSEANYRLYNSGTVSGTGYFHGSNLGAFTSPSQTLAISFWDIKTWKNGSSDVQQAELYYRIYEFGGTPGSYTLVIGGWLEDLGSGNQKWGKSSSTSIDISTLEAGKTWVLEVYIRVYGTVPNEWKYDSNDGVDFEATFTTDSAFPVELSSFTAVRMNNKIKLNWTTSTEVNNYGFEVERSSISDISKENWQKIGFVHGKGNSNSLNYYTFIDENPISGNNFYRLKQIDSDGAVKYSQIIEIENNEKLSNDFILNQNYPNPFNPTTKISWFSPIDSWQTLKIYDVLGNEIATLVDEFREAGSYEIEFPTAETISASSLPNGVYIYQLKIGNYAETKKMSLVK